jgi:two-component sensor histidine kinase
LLLGATARSSQSIDQFYRSFADRIVALAHTHALLTEDYWQTASLREMLLAELGPFKTNRENRFVLNGPEIHLSADLAVPLGMAIHELCTNAAKYGSLSRPEGRVVWEIREREGARKLRLEWREEGGPPVEQPRCAGFGSTLIQRVLMTQCNAEVRYEFEPSGVRLELEAPLVVARLVPSYERD